MKFILLILLLFLYNLTFSNDIDTILNEADKVISPPNISGVFNLTLISKSKDERQFNANAYQKRVNENQENRVFIFNYPPSVKNTGLLVHSFFDESDTRMWLYLPAVKRIKRIALETSGGGYFMGSDFTYSDLISRSSEEYIYTLIGDKDINGDNCYMVKAQGVDKSTQESMGYSYTINYYRKSDYLIVGIDYYDLAEELMKEYRVEKVEILGQYLYPSRVVMTNIQSSHISIIEFSKLSIGNIPKEYFTHLYLKEK